VLPEHRHGSGPRGVARGARAPTTAHRVSGCSTPGRAAVLVLQSTTQSKTAGAARGGPLTPHGTRSGGNEPRGRGGSRRARTSSSAKPRRADDRAVGKQCGNGERARTYLQGPASDAGRVRRCSRPLSPERALAGRAPRHPRGGRRRCSARQKGRGQPVGCPLAPTCRRRQRVSPEGRVCRNGNDVDAGRDASAWCPECARCARHQVR